MRDPISHPSEISKTRTSQRSPTSLEDRTLWVVLASLWCRNCCAALVCFISTSATCAGSRGKVGQQNSWPTREAIKKRPSADPKGLIPSDKVLVGLGGYGRVFADRTVSKVQTAKEQTADPSEKSLQLPLHTTKAAMSYFLPCAQEGHAGHACKKFMCWVDAFLVFHTYCTKPFLPYVYII